MSDSTASDTIIRNARVFSDGLPAVHEDVAISNGRIVERGPNLQAGSDTQVIDASGKWLMPGLFDIHTHYDLELEVAPGLPESVRHGTTTVAIGNCSIGLAFGNQREKEQDHDPIVDCFARVENLPKSMLRRCADSVDWHTPKEYMSHLEQLNLGPNVATLLPHSMLRIEAMGFEDSISRDPTPTEMESMENMLNDALNQGFIGFSSDALPFHYLAHERFCMRTIPTQFAKYDEIKRLTEVTRNRDALWQATPPKDSPYNTIKTFLLTCGRFHRKPLRTTVVAALDITNNRTLLYLAKVLSRLLNHRWLKGDFHLQALGAPFKTWSDGAMTPLAEEIPELRRLNETNLEDRARRQEIMQDPEYVAAFKAMWMKGKRGFGPARLKRWLNLEEYAFHRNLAEMEVDSCPVGKWEGMDLNSVLKRVQSVNKGQIPPELSNEEAEIIRRDFEWIEDEADFMLQLLRSFDTDLIWSTTTANRNEKTVRALLMDPLLLPGFNDSGAHLTNMAFYDCNLRSLKLAAEGSEADVSYMVKRLTRDVAKLLNVDGGSVAVGEVADLILVDPERLAQYDGEKHVQRIYREEYQHHQLVNRSDGVVPLVMIAGHVAWQNDQFGQELGQKPFGRLLKPNEQMSATAQRQEVGVHAPN